MVTATETLIGEKELSVDYLSGSHREHALHRWIFAITAAWFIVIILVGFIPDSLDKASAIESGRAHPFPLVEHVHAVLMGSFMLLLLTQTMLMATGWRTPHRQLGVAAFALVPAIMIAGFMLLSAHYHDAWGSAPLALRRMNFPPDNLMLMQFQAGILFPLLMTIGLAVRRSNPGLHKRMMLLAPAMALGASIILMTWLPNTFPASPLGTELYILLTVLPLLVWDVIRNRRLHEAYLIWLAMFVPFAVTAWASWGTAWWHAAAQRLMGV